MTAVAGAARVLTTAVLDLLASEAAAVGAHSAALCHSGVPLELQRKLKCCTWNILGSLLDWEKRVWVCLSVQGWHATLPATRRSWGFWTVG